MHVDENRNGRVDDNEAVLELAAPAPEDVTISANRPIEDYVSYTSLGHARMLNGALQMGTFTVCRRGQNALGGKTPKPAINLQAKTKAEVMTALRQWGAATLTSRDGH